LQVEAGDPEGRELGQSRLDPIRCTKGNSAGRQPFFENLGGAVGFLCSCGQRRLIGGVVDPSDGNGRKAQTNLRRVTACGASRPAADLDSLSEVVGRAREEVELVAVSAGERRGAIGAGPAGEEWNLETRCGSELFQLIVLPDKAFAATESAQIAELLLEELEALSLRRKGETEQRVFLGHPTGPKAEGEATPGHIVDGRRHLGVNCRVPKCDRRNQVYQMNSRGLAGQAGEMHQVIPGRRFDVGR